MKKIILSFALFFALLFINSCKEDDTVSPDTTSPKLLAYDISYNDSSPDYYKFVYSNDKIDTIYYISPRKDSIIIKFKYIGNNISEVINYNTTINKYYYRKYEYTNDLLTKFTYSFDNRLVQTNIYTYENKKIKSLYISTELSDSIVVTSFVGNRPENIKSFIKKNNLMVFNNETKVVYRNGNREELYYRQDTTKDWTLKAKYTFDESKLYVAKLCPAFVYSQPNFYELPNDFETNVLISQTVYDYECNGVKNENLVEVSKRSHQNTFTSKGYLNSYNIIESSNCSDNILNIKANFTWE